MLPVTGVTRIRLNLRPFHVAKKKGMGVQIVDDLRSPILLTIICRGAFSFFSMKNYFKAFNNPDMVTSPLSSQAITFLFRAAG